MGRQSIDWLGLVHRGGCVGYSRNDAKKAGEIVKLGQECGAFGFICSTQTYDHLRRPRRVSAAAAVSSSSGRKGVLLE